MKHLHAKPAKARYNNFVYAGRFEIFDFLKCEMPLKTP